MAQFFTVITRKGSKLDRYLYPTFRWIERKRTFDGKIVYTVIRLKF